jgi:prophage antirepressor-like protein
MKHKIVKNSDLNLAFFYWEGRNGRLFLASQVMKQLGYKGGNNALKNLELIDGVDRFTMKKKDDAQLFTQLRDLKSLGQRAVSVIMLSESGVWKLIMQSRKQVGINTRNWLAKEVLPSIRASGKYDISESENNPFSQLAGFTERPKQIENSKTVNAIIYKGDGDFSRYHDEVHKMVTGLTAKQIKQLYKSKASAREVLREYAPQFATTEAIIDDIYKRGVGLEKIKESNIAKTMPPAINSLFACGIKLEEL